MPNEQRAKLIDKFYGRLLWHETWELFSLSGATKRENINQITKIREPNFQGQLKFILQTPY
jgi:hypothetical protein